LLRVLYCVLPVKFGPLLVCLLIRVLIDPEIFDLASTRGSLVDRKTRREFSVCTYLYRIQHRHREILAVVADEIVRRSLLPHIVDDHFA